MDCVTYSKVGWVGRNKFAIYFHKSHARLLSRPMTAVPEGFAPLIPLLKVPVVPLLKARLIPLLKAMTWRQVG
jgi:hypothetical protein